MEKLIAVGQELWVGLGIILTHRMVWVCLGAWFSASIIKVILFFIQNRWFDFRILIDTGRMPSSHSAFVACLATVIGLEAGWGSPVFMLSLGFALLTMNDAQGVRRAAGHQAMLLNRVVDDIYKRKPIRPARMKEFLGHTPIQVLSGALIGISFGAWFYW